MAYDVISICNALVDILVPAKEADIGSLNLVKGRMHLVDESAQNQVLAHFDGADTKTELGGSSLNALRTLASLGLRTSFAGMVGDDAYGQLLRRRMESLGIHASLKTSTDATGTCLILVTPDGERTMNTNLGASRMFNEDLVPESALQTAQIFHFCGYQWDTDGQIRAIEKACRLAGEHAVQISFDVADPFVVERHRERFIELIAGEADIVFANEEEARILFSSTAEGAVDKIMEGGAIAVVKRGAKGALIGSKGRVVEIPPEPTNAIDTTAAGDMFAAGVLYGLAKGQSLEVSGRLGSLLASDVISRVGAVVSDQALEKVRGLVTH